MVIGLVDEDVGDEYFDLSEVVLAVMGGLVHVDVDCIGSVLSVSPPKPGTYLLYRLVSTLFRLGL